MKYEKVRALLARNLPNLLYLFILSLLLLFPAALAPVFQKVFTDSVLQGNAREWLAPMLVLMGLMALLSGGLTCLKQTVLHKMSHRIETTGESRYFWNLFHAPLQKLLGEDTVTLLERVDDAREVTEPLTEEIISVSFRVVDVALYMFMMFQIDALMSWIVLGLGLVSFLFRRLRDFIQDRIEARDGNAGPDADELQRAEERIGFDGLQNIEVIKSSASEQHFFERLMGVKNAALTRGQDDDYEEAYGPLDDLPEVVFMNLLLFIAALRIMDKSFTIGSYLAFSAYASTLFSSLSQILNIREPLEEFEENLMNIAPAQGLSLPTTVVEKRDGATAKLAGRVELRHVSFAYDNDRMVLHDVDLCIQPGERVAIVGRSGAGKSTLLGLLQGLMEPTEGSVLLDGMAPSAIDPAVYRASVGAAHQQVRLLSASVRENIALWDEALDDAQIYQAAQDAGLHEYVASLPGAYAYPLLENGRNLSGGQRQKLEITRALLYRPTIVLLDEATISMDPQSIAAVEDALLRRGCTCIVASHVIEHLTDYDVIYVLDEGRLVARGTHGTLLESCPLYARLYNAEEGRVAI